jgi:hypothetical protein
MAASATNCACQISNVLRLQHETPLDWRRSSERATNGRAATAAQTTASWHSSTVAACCNLRCHVVTGAQTCRHSACRRMARLTRCAASRHSRGIIRRPTGNQFLRLINPQTGGDSLKPKISPEALLKRAEVAVFIDRDLGRHPSKTLRESRRAAGCRILAAGRSTAEKALRAWVEARAR